MSNAAAAIENGAWVLSRNLQVREQTAALQREARELVLTFRFHRVRPMFGGSDTDRQEECRQRLAALVACSPVKTYVGQSRGSACKVCGTAIVVGDIEYDVVSIDVEVRLDCACYLLLVDELGRLKPEV